MRKTFSPHVFKDASGLPKIGLISAPFGKGQSHCGVELGPQAICDQGLIKHLERLGWVVEDHIALCFETYDEVLQASTEKIHGVKNPDMVYQAVHKLSEVVEDQLRKGRFPLTLGGDHSLGLGAIFGNASVNQNLCVLWIDAHADINTVQTTKTGHFHGMPVSFLLKEIQSRYNRPNALLPQFDAMAPCVSAANFAYIGLRDIDDSENEILDRLRIPYFSMRDVDKFGISEVVCRALERINPGLERPIHVSFDIDSIDEYFAPSTGVATPAGLTLREVFCIGEQIAQTCRLNALDLVEVNPLIGDQAAVSRTTNAALNVILSFLGKPRMSLYGRAFG